MCRGAVPIKYFCSAVDVFNKEGVIAELKTVDPISIRSGIIYLLKL